MVGILCVDLGLHTAVCLLRLVRRLLCVCPVERGSWLSYPRLTVLWVSFGSFVVHIGVLGWILVAEFWFREFSG